jgi:hypothetical protein
MALNLNSSTLAAVVEKAAFDAAAHPRWLTAIGRAILELDSNPWIERGELHGLVIGSPSGNVYSANGVCQCDAYKHGKPCWHRAAARLVRLHDEALERQQAAPADWPQDLATGKPMDWYAAKRAVETGTIRPMGERLAAARKATAELNELFA